MQELPVKDLSFFLKSKILLKIIEEDQVFFLLYLEINSSVSGTKLPQTFELFKNPGVYY
jgi:hypothetical protein